MVISTVQLPPMAKELTFGSARPRPVILTADAFERNAEIKLLLGCSEEETQIALACHNNDKMRAVLVCRPKEKT
jgi:hypothetical protein